MSELDDFMTEVQCFDEKMFGEIGGNEAMLEIRLLRATVEKQRSEAVTMTSIGGRAAEEALQLRAEVKRLRGALGSICTLELLRTNGKSAIFDIASEALENKS